MKDQTKIQLKEEFESYIKKNALGLVCECGGGGTDDNNTCKKCGGCGVYEWRVHNIDEMFDKIYNSLLQSQRDSLEKDNDIVPKNMELTRSLVKGVDIGKEEILKELLMEQHKNELDGKGYDFYFAIRTKLDSLIKQNN